MMIKNYGLLKLDWCEIGFVLLMTRNNVLPKGTDKAAVELLYIMYIYVNKTINKYPGCT